MKPLGARPSARRWWLLALGLLAACSSGGQPYAGLAEGDCVRGNPNQFPPELAVIDCADFQMMKDHKVLGTQQLPAGDYPASFADYERDCSGLTITPSRQTWEEGDRTLLCLGVFSGKSGGG